MSKKRLDIQGLRGWAITFVLLFHFFPDYFPNGYIGVDIFFVISGFLIAMILRRSENLDVEAFRSFYYRRIKRILPLYYLAIACILIALFLFLPSSYRSINIDSSRRAILLISNIINDAEDEEADYQSRLLDAEDLFTHTWSLCVEMQWYLLVPLIFVVQRLATTWEKTFFTGVATSSIMFYLLVDDKESFYNVFARIWQFCCGVLALLMHKEDSANDLPQYEKMALLDSKNCKACGQQKLCKPTFLSLSKCVFSMVVVPFIWLPLPKDIFRASITFLSTIFILAGSYHQTILLSNPVAVYMGDISYALYLIHWPVYIIATLYSAHIPFALALGVGFSILLAIATYHFFEKHYLTWPPQGVLSILAVLVSICAILALQPHSIDELRFGCGPVNYSAINPNDASWNMTLMRYLNFKEDKPRGNAQIEGCHYSKKFVNKSLEPYGFCSMNDGPGKYDFLVLGNSFACNQGDMVYKSFKNYARKFNIFCVTGCEVLTMTSSKICHIRVNYTTVLHELKPDVVFLMSRSFAAKERFNTMKPIVEDRIFQNQLKRMAEIENIAKKVYLLQALPTCRKPCCMTAEDFIRNGRPLNELKDGLIDQDDFYARKRIRELGKRCRKCQVFDYLPLLLDRKGHYLGYNPENNLMYLDRINHFNRFGKQKLQPLFDRLAAEFEISN